MCSKISDLLLQEKGHYVQAINYPTVPIGQEKLRMAPTPHHTAEMIDTLVEDMLDVWVKLGVPVKAVRIHFENPISYSFICFKIVCNLLFLDSLQHVQ